ncbi:MAG: ATP-binding protein [Desulfovibrionaceae bacterium]
MTIKSRLILHFVGLAAAPLVLTALVLAWQGLLILHQQAQSLLDGAARSAVHRVESHFSNLAGELRLATRLLAAEPPSRTEWTSTLKVLLDAGQQDVLGLAMLEADGQVLAQAGRFLDLGLEAQLAPRQQTAVVTRDDLETMITIAVPFTSVKAGRSAFLAGSASLEPLIPVLDKLSSQCQGAVMLTDLSGQVLLRASQASANTPDPAPLDRLDITTSRRVEGMGADLMIVAEQPWTVAFRPAIRSAAMTALALVLSLAVSALLAVLASRRIVRPLQSLATAAKRLQAGDLEARVEEDGSDELATTSHAFNAMAAKLSESLDGLREQVEMRKDMEARLRLSEAKARSLVNASMESAFLVDTSDTILTANAVGAELFGLQPGDMEGRSFKDFLSPEVYERRRQKVEQAIETREPVRFEDIRDGRVWDVLLSPIQDQESVGISQVAVFSRDVTATRMAEQSLQLHKTRLEALVALSRMTEATNREVADFVLEKGIELTRSKRGFINLRDDEGRFLAYAYSKDTMRDCSMGDKPKVFDVEHGGLWAEAVRRKEPVIVNDYDARQEGKKGLPEGHVGLQRFVAAPVVEGGEVVAVAGVSDKDAEYDFTDAIQLTLLMEGMLQHLRRISAAHELQRARDEALSANEAKSEFLAHMSHEIRTPLQGVIGLVESSLRTADDPELSRNLGLVRDASHSMLTVVNDILDFSRIEAGKLDIVEENVNLRKLVDNVLGLFGFLANDKGVRLVSSIDPRAPEYVRTDPDRLRQILANLVSNAVKFTEDGEVELAAEVESLHGDDAVDLSLSVRDTGPGIPDTQREAIFEAFQQAGPQVTRRYGGTGLGLAISARLAKLLHGDLSVESQEGKGSTFVFRSRFAIPAAGAPPAGEEPAETEAPSPGQSLRVLLAEDTLINQVFIEDILTREGHQVTVADNGLQALEALERQRFDVVLMDLQMPEMDGLEATRRIRENPPGPNPADLPVAALTAFAMESDRQMALDAGVNEYLSKPVQVDELLAVIARLAGDTDRPAPGRNQDAQTRTQGAPMSFQKDLAAQFRPEVVQEMLALFERLSEERLQQMRDALDQNDLKTLAADAHALAGNAGTIRALELAELARRLQQSALENRKDDCRALLQRLEERVGEVQEAIRAQR